MTLFVIDDAFTGQSRITNGVIVGPFRRSRRVWAGFAPTTTGFVIRAGVCWSRRAFRSRAANKRDTSDRPRCSLLATRMFPRPRDQQTPARPGQTSTRRPFVDQECPVKATWPLPTEPPKCCCAKFWTARRGPNHHAVGATTPKTRPDLEEPRPRIRSVPSFVGMNYPGTLVATHSVESTFVAPAPKASSGSSTLLTRSL